MARLSGMVGDCGGKNGSWITSDGTPGDHSNISRLAVQFDRVEIGDALKKGVDKSWTAQPGQGKVRRIVHFKPRRLSDCKYREAYSEDSSSYSIRGSGS